MSDYPQFVLDEDERRVCLSYARLMREAHLGLVSVKHLTADPLDPYADGKLSEWAFASWCLVAGIPILHEPFRRDYTRLDPKDDFIVELAGKPVQIEVKHKTRNVAPQPHYEVCTERFKNGVVYVFTMRERDQDALQYPIDHPDHYRGLTFLLGWIDGTSGWQAADFEYAGTVKRGGAGQPNFTLRRDEYNLPISALRPMSELVAYTTQERSTHEQDERGSVSGGNEDRRSLQAYEGATAHGRADARPGTGGRTNGPNGREAATGEPRRGHLLSAALPRPQNQAGAVRERPVRGTRHPAVEQPSARPDVGGNPVPAVHDEGGRNTTGDQRGQGQGSPAGDAPAGAGGRRPDRLNALLDPHGARPAPFWPQHPDPGAVPDYEDRLEYQRRTGKVSHQAVRALAYRKELRQTMFRRLALLTPPKPPKKESNSWQSPTPTSPCGLRGHHETWTDPTGRLCCATCHPQPVMRPDQQPVRLWQG